MSVLTAVESIKATLEAADAAIDRAQQAIDTALSRGVSGPAYLAGLARALDGAVSDRDRIDALLAEKKMAQYRAEQAEEFRRHE